MRMKTDKERREALRKRVQKNIENKDKGGDFGNRGLLDISGRDVNWYKEDEFGIPLDKDKTTFECQIDIIPYIIRTDHHPDGMEAGLEDYILDVWRHRGIGPMNQEVLCLWKTFGKPCPICEERQRLLDSGLDWDDDKVKELSPVRRAMYNVIDVNDPEEKIRLFTTTHAYFEKLLVKEVELSPEEMQDFPDLQKGKTVKFRAEKHKFGKGHYFKYSNFKFLDRQAYPEEILEETLPLDEMLIIPTYEDVQIAFLGLPDKEDGAPAQQEQKPEPERKSKWRSGEQEPPKQEPGRRKRGAAEPEKEPEQALDEPPYIEPPQKEEKTAPSPPSATSGECPHGHRYGVDTDAFPADCAECEKWSACDDEKERLQKAGKEEKPPAAAASTTGMRRKRG
uniref:Uncharacterized protein n=1 Tax=viral metagenome TaxID=1070528 RepID=A0A6M3ILW8_9ZZZZ